MNFHLPPRILNSKGEKRRVGFELEFGGLDLNESALIIQRLFGGKIESGGQYVRKVATDLGEFQLEADSSFLKKRKYEKYLALIGIKPTDMVNENIDAMFGMLAGTLVPFEIVTPPLNIDNLSPVEKIREELHRHSARGTNASLFSAFGMQFNPEVPSLDVQTLHSYLRAFFLLFDWLYEECEIPVARKVAPFIASFPEEYVRLVINPNYRPSRREFMNDYLTYNPTRNRPLDMLPLFAHIDKAMVFSYPVETELVKPRPTFHYRLPNSMVDDRSWKIAADWNKWVEIERLAFDEMRMRHMTEDFLFTRNDNFIFVHSKWVEKTRRWLHG